MEITQDKFTGIIQKIVSEITIFYNLQFRHKMKIRMNVAYQIKNLIIIFFLFQHKTLKVKLYVSSVNKTYTTCILPENIKII